jgi:GT2 family glycosyltransferase
MPEYFNPNSFSVYLTGPDGKLVIIRSRKKAILSDFFDRYRERGFIKLISEIKNQSNIDMIKATHTRISLRKPKRVIPVVAAPQPANKEKTSQEELIALEKKKRRQPAKVKPKVNIKTKVRADSSNNVVGISIKADSNQVLKDNLENGNYPISNNIGIGILSYNRAESLKRCVQSILQNTDLKQTTVFISDDCSTDQNIKEYLNELESNRDIVVIRNSERLGVAGNTNRLLRCLSRFKYGILLNDDVEIKRKGWDTFYIDSFNVTGMHHFIFRQEGVYGARKGQQVVHKGLKLWKVDEKPHGAVLAFTNDMFNRVGYFNESYGIYGMEHVDWSLKAYEFGLQVGGFFDVDGSEEYFVLHSDKSSVDNKSQHLKEARDIFKQRLTTYGGRIYNADGTIYHKRTEASDATKVDSISYVVPFRNVDRTDAVRTVINNIRAQKFPDIEIILVEQDIETRVEVDKCKPINYILAMSKDKQLFNKSLAFNVGVSNSKFDDIVLHDADMLVKNDYTSTIFKTLQTYEACHLGKTVIYADSNSSDRINRTGSVEQDTRFERIVGYYEGGSIACKKYVYWRCGGFNEDFWGYGCEDCDFYSRISITSNWFGERSYDLLHLWHGRVNNWRDHHEINVNIERMLKQKSIQERVQLQCMQITRLGYRSYVNDSDQNNRHS